MVRLWLLLGLVAAIFYIYSIVDCVLVEPSRARGLPKPAWVIVILIFPVVGGLLWFLVGRGSRRRELPVTRTVAPDDDPEFLARLKRENEREQRLRRREQELGEMDGPQAKPSKKKGDNNDKPGRRDG